MKFFINNINYFILFFLAYIYVLGFPPIGYWPLTFIAIIIITRIINRVKSVKHLIISAFAFALGIGIFGFYWIFYSVQYVIQSNILGALTLVGFSFLYSLFIVVPFFFMSNFNKINHTSFVTTAFSWGLFEVLKFYFLGGFPWFTLATIWDSYIYMQQIVVLIGSLGLAIFTTILVSFVNSLLKRQGFKSKIKHSLVIISALLVVNVFGFLRIEEFRSTDYEQYIPIRIVQTDVKQSEKMSYSKQNKIFYDTVELAFKDIDYIAPPKYIVLPEVAFNFVLEEQNDKFQELKNKIPKNSTLLIGVLRKEGNKYYNSMYAISGKTKQVVSSYDKIKLVPFGEYIPYSNYIPFVSNFVGLSNLESGTKQIIFQIESYLKYTQTNVTNTKLKELSEADKFLVLICFEIIFSNYSAHYTNVDWVLNIGNEGWFNSSSEQSQHLSLAKLRAIEGVVPVVKSSNNGYSGIINIVGALQVKYLSLQKNNLDVYLPVGLPKSNFLLTFGKIYYNIIAVLFLLLSYGLYIILFFKSKSGQS